MQFPAGAVASDMMVTARKLVIGTPDGKSTNVYEIGQGDITLKTNATLTLPFDNASVPKNASDSDIRVAYYKQNEGWTEVPAGIDRASGKATVQTNHFSIWGVFWPGFWSSQFDPKKPAAVLSVPHYYQGGAGWCWAASTAMLLKYYGKDVEIWDIAAAFGSGYDVGLSGGECLIGYYSAYVQAQGFQTERSLVGWQEFNEFRGYVAHQISLGRPVWTALSSPAHAVLIVGSGGDGIHINDPSGLLLEFVGKKVDEKRLNPIFLSWEDFYKVWAKNSLRGAGFNHTLVITGASAAQTPPITMTVLTGSIDFTIPRPPGSQNDFNNSFKWDGTNQPNGYLFTGLFPFFYGLPENNPTNSDTITKFAVNLSNSRTSDARATLTLMLDGKQIREKRDIVIPARTTNLQVDLMKDAAYALKDVLLTPGEHRFDLTLDEGGQSGDRMTIRVTIGPSQPTNLKVERSGDTAKLTWDQSPEKKKGIANVAYLVWRDNQQYKTVAENKFDDTEAKGDHDYRVEALVMVGDRIISGIVSARPLKEVPTVATFKLAVVRATGFTPTEAQKSTGLSCAITRQGATVSDKPTTKDSRGIAHGAANYDLSWQVPEQIAPGVPFTFSITGKGALGATAEQAVRAEFLSAVFPGPSGQPVDKPVATGPWTMTSRKTPNNLLPGTTYIPSYTRHASVAAEHRRLGQAHYAWVVSGEDIVSEVTLQPTTDAQVTLELKVGSTFCNGTATFVFERQK